jgi:myo-inositol-1(or 4)-monophosphatase
MAIVLDELIDGSSMRGGFFELGSATFAITRVVTGQLDAYIDVSQHVLDAFPALTPRFRAACAGGLCTNFAYDVAAAALIVTEAGGIVTKPDGTTISEHPAIGSGEGFGIAVVASASRQLHDTLLVEIDRGMSRLGAWLQRERELGDTPIE